MRFNLFANRNRPINSIHNLQRQLNRQYRAAKLKYEEDLKKFDES